MRRENCRMLSSNILKASGWLEANRKRLEDKAPADHPEKGTNGRFFVRENGSRQQESNPQPTVYKIEGDRYKPPRPTPISAVSVLKP